MSAVVLGWVPGPTDRWSGSYDRCVQRTRDGQGVLERWPVGDGRLTPVGTSVHLVAQDGTPGLMGRGIVRSASWLSADPSHPGQVTRHVIIEWTTLLPPAERIPTSILAAQVPRFPWQGAHVGVRPLDAAASAQVDLVWAGHAARPHGLNHPWEQLPWVVRLPADLASAVTGRISRQALALARSHRDAPAATTAQSHPRGSPPEPGPPTR